MKCPTSFFFIIFSVLQSCQSGISISEGEIREGQECFTIRTPGATYYYQKAAGGFSNILDNNGVDWIKFHKTDSAGFPRSAASDYRGLPNLVYQSADGGCGHPGFAKMTSEKISDHQIRSISKSGQWEWTWSFYDDYAHLSIEQTDQQTPYWFLYEGPIAGKFSPATHYWGTDQEGPLTDQPDLILGPERYGKWQTVYFGDRNYDHTFFVKQIQADSIQDLYTYMGNTRQGNKSPDGMVVFGFGRAPGATPLLYEKHEFIIGVYDQKIEDEKGHLALMNYIDGLTHRDDRL